MKKILSRLPHSVFLALLISNIVYFLGLLFFAQAKVRSVGVVLITILGLVGLSGLAHFLPATLPDQWPQLSSLPQRIQLTRPQLAHSIAKWQDVYTKQSRSEMVALTLRSLCLAGGQTDCVDQTNATIQELNPALVSPTP